MFEGGTRTVVEWFDLGARCPERCLVRRGVVTQSRGVQGLRSSPGRGLALGAGPGVASAIDFVLEGLRAEDQPQRGTRLLSD